MGIEEASLSAAITKNIEQALEQKKITKHELVARTSIAKSTFYRNMKRPEDFSCREVGEIAKALDLGITDLVKQDRAS
jgi:DNA-binding Xre family transcriptional regulator